MGSARIVIVRDGVMGYLVATVETAPVNVGGLRNE